MKSIRVSLGARSYNIEGGPLGPRFIQRLKQLKVGSTGIFVVTSAGVARAGHAQKLLRLLTKAGFRTTLHTLPDGEKQKNFQNLERLYSKGFRFKLDRHSAVIGLGGGVVTDLAGFFAATYMRGIDFVSIPTTLLGMVDAAIGGKTGVDRPEGKNLVGAFWQPRLVWIDVGTLKTLPVDEWRTGFAEVLKYGVIADASFYRWLAARVEKQPSFRSWPLSHVEKAIHRSASLKAKVVGGDEREKPLAGGREILNYGHTSGHALEATRRYRGITHGQAISIGMVVAGYLALDKGLWSLSAQNHLKMVLNAAGLPIHFPVLSSSENRRFWSSLLKDKKAIGGNLRFVLPKTLGRAIVQSGISVSTLKDALRKTQKI